MKANHYISTKTPSFGEKMISASELFASAFFSFSSFTGSTFTAGDSLSFVESEKNDPKNRSREVQYMSIWFGCKILSKTRKMAFCSQGVPLSFQTRFEDQEIISVKLVASQYSPSLPKGSSLCCAWDVECWAVTARKPLKGIENWKFFAVSLFLGLTHCYLPPYTTTSTHLPTLRAAPSAYAEHRCPLAPLPGGNPK